MNTKKIVIPVAVSWLAQIGLVILMSIATRSVNQKMYWFILIVPALVNLPLLLRATNHAERALQNTMVGLSGAEYLAALITMVVNPHYYSLIRGGIASLSIVGLAALAALVFQSIKHQT